MGLRQLRYFVAVAEEEHFGRAAKRLHIVQPALSMQIRSLEAKLGGPLFQRTSRRVVLTEAGSILLADARRLLAQADRVRSDVRRSLKGEIGSVRIGFVGSTIFGGELIDDLRLSGVDRQVTVDPAVRHARDGQIWLRQIAEHGAHIGARPPYSWRYRLPTVEPSVVCPKYFRTVRITKRSGAKSLARHCAGYGEIDAEHRGPMHRRALADQRPRDDCPAARTTNDRSRRRVPCSPPDCGQSEDCRTAPGCPGRVRLGGRVAPRVRGGKAASRRRTTRESRHQV
ncbi:DNA-binding transcriptional LysR family regulator [Paraburkholderia sp. GAS448]